MAPLVFAYDHSRDPMSPGDLGDKIAAALTLPDSPFVDIDPTSITVTHPNVTEANRAAIQTVISAYVIDTERARFGQGTQVTLQLRALNAIHTNIDALALPDPTAANNAYLGHAAIPGGTLTTAQLSSIVRTLSDQVDALTRQNNALIAQTRALTRQNTTLIRLLLGVTDSTAGTNSPAAKP